MRYAIVAPFAVVAVCSLPALAAPTPSGFVYRRGPGGQAGAKPPPSSTAGQSSDLLDSSMGEDTMGGDLMDLGAGATPGQGFPSSPKPTPSGAGGGLLMRQRSDDLWVRKLIDELVARASTGSVAGASAVPPSSSSKPLAADDDNERLPEEDELGMEPSGSSAFGAPRCAGGTMSSGYGILP
ncbi:hypothetical protein EVJ58_g5097, partial [Rhodofomes roseus]